MYSIVDANRMVLNCKSRMEALEVFFWEIVVRIRVEALRWFIDLLRPLKSVAAPALICK